MTQYQLLCKLLTRKKGVTSMEIIDLVGTVCPHRRLADLKEAGWTILKKPVPGKNFNRYFGVPPQVA